MKRLIKLLPIALLALAACNNNVVSSAEYEAALSRAESLEAQNDSLQFELQDLKLYNEYLEKTLDSLQAEP